MEVSSGGKELRQEEEGPHVTAQGTEPLLTRLAPRNPSLLRPLNQVDQGTNQRHKELPGNSHGDPPDQAIASRFPRDNGEGKEGSSMSPELQEGIKARQDEMKERWIEKARPRLGSL